MSKPFIRLSDDEKDWYIYNNYDLPIVSNIPVISIIGTARDGKSTMLNVFDNYMKKENTNPFIFKNGMKTCTRGIDFYKTDEYMLLDCEGMANKGAKFDHYFTILAYLMSNTIILNVRQTLDIQVMSNMLAVFSFLAEIPIEHRRKNKILLFIRIKDFQDTDILEENPEYLSDFVDEWLQPNNDQYDKIKEAFRENFDIKIGYTERPVIKKGKVDINSKNFFKDNESFETFCETIWKYSKKMKAPTILSSAKTIIDIVKHLKEDETMNWKKFDMYHQITENGLRKYTQKILMNSEINDFTLKDKMDGMKNGYDLYMARETLYEKMRSDAYNKYNDIAQSIVEEILDPVFEKLHAHIKNAREANHEKATKFIEPYYEKFKSKYKNYVDFDNVVNKIIYWFDESKKELCQQLDLIDVEVKNRIDAEISAEQQKLEKIQKDITKLNKKHISIIDKKMKQYESSIRFIDYIKDKINYNIDNNSYNCDAMTVLKDIKTTVANEITKIVTDNDLTYYMGENYDVFSTSGHIKYDHSAYMPNENDYVETYWSYLEGKLTSLGFLRDVNTNILTEINFIQVKCNAIQFYVTERMYKAYDMKKLLDELNYCTVNQETVQNVLKINISINNEIIDPRNADVYFSEKMTYDMTTLICKFCIKHKLQYHNYY